MRVLFSALTGRAYVVTKYHMDGGTIVADQKTEVTADVVNDLMAMAWARGWNECNTAHESDAPPNPYRTSAPPDHIRPSERNEPT